MKNTIFSIALAMLLLSVSAEAGLGYRTFEQAGSDYAYMDYPDPGVYDISESIVHDIRWLEPDIPVHLDQRDYSSCSSENDPCCGDGQIEYCGNGMHCTKDGLCCMQGHDSYYVLVFEKLMCVDVD